jgi:hypothetical protein
LDGVNEREQVSCLVTAVAAKKDYRSEMSAFGLQGGFKKYNLLCPHQQQQQYITLTYEHKKKLKR